MSVILELSALHKSFGKATAVSGIDLEIHHGELVCLLGPSGCGKTTTLRLIAGFERPTKGEILLSGRPISTSRSGLPPEKRGMAMMFQSYAVWPHMTVGQNVAYGLVVRRVAKGSIGARVRNALDVVQMGEYINRYPSELSGGQQQRVSFARAFVTDPTILLMDEPLSNLDVKLRAEMRNELRDLHKRLHFTGVYVTHDQEEAMTVADRIVVMRDGLIEQVGTPAELYKQPANAYVASFLGGANTLPGVMCSSQSIRVGTVDLPCTNSAGLGSGAAADAIIRPRNVWLVDRSAHATPLCLDFIIESATFLGDVVHCRLYGQQLEATVMASLRSAEPLRHGEKIRCQIGEVLAVPTDRGNVRSLVEEGESLPATGRLKSETA